MLDTNLLRIMRTRQDFLALSAFVTPESLTAEARVLLNDYGKYFQKFPEHTEIDWNVFVPRFRQWHKDLPKEKFAAYIPVIREAGKPVDKCTRDGIVQDILEAGLVTSLANLAFQWEAGDAPDVVNQIGEALDRYKVNVNAKLAHWIDDPIDELLKEELNNEGIKWRLETLNKSMRPLRPGDFGIIAARPDKGKTSFISSECTFFAPQLEPDRNILWFNNEGPGRRIVPRLYQSALGIDMEEMIGLKRAGTLEDQYREAVGRLDRIRVVDIHGMSIGSVEAIIERSEAEVCIFDMIDNISGFGSESRNDLVLEKMYQRARELGVKHGTINLATSQISNDGDGEMFPTLGMLKDSKTGKQGACDFQLMIGATNDPSMQSARYLSLPKNKLRTAFGPGDPQAEVHFNAMKARYEDLKEDTPGLTSGD